MEASGKKVHDMMNLTRINQHDVQIATWFADQKRAGGDRAQLIRERLQGAKEFDLSNVRELLSFEPYTSKQSGRRYIKVGEVARIPSAVIGAMEDLPIPEGTGAVDVPVPKFDEAGNLVPKKSYILVFTPDQYGQLLAAWETQNQEES